MSRPDYHTEGPLSIRLPTELRAWIAVKASDENRSVASVVTEALERLRERDEHYSRASRAAREAETGES